jgi:YVTN family beta-propeller protein
MEQVMYTNHVGASAQAANGLLAGKLRRVCAAAALAAGVFVGPALAQAPGSAFVYTADEYGKSVSAIDLRTGQVTTTAIAIAPHNIQITADGKRLLAVGDPAGDDHGHGAEDAAHAAAAETAEAAGLLLVLDPDRLEAGPVTSVPVGSHPAHVVADAAASRAFVTNAGDDAVAVVDLSTNQVIRRIQVGRYPHGLRLSPNEAELYVAAVEEGAVSVIDPESLAEVARIPVGAAPVQVGFTPDGARLYVSLRDENRVAVIDTATRQVVAKVDVGRNPIQVYATPDGTRVYVANQGTDAEPEDTVSVIDVATNAVIDTITTGQGAHGVAVSDDGAQVFVTNIVADSVSLIEESSRSVIKTYQVGDGPNGITFRAATGQTAQDIDAEHNAHHPQTVEAAQPDEEAARAAVAEPGRMMSGGQSMRMMQNMMRMQEVGQPAMGMMGGGMMPQGSMGPGMMGHGMMRMMVIMMDADGDGAVSLEEFQAVHERMFKALDADGDGRVTPEELESFMRGSAPTQQ